MIITQTVEISADRRLKIDMPPGVPAGMARVEVKVIPFVNKEERSGKIRLSKKAIDEMLQNSPHTLALTGILRTDMTAKEIREERLAKYSQ